MRRYIGAVALAAVLASGCADNATSSPGGSTIEITMRDNSYSPRTVTVPKGQTVVLRFVNRGAVDHEAIIGDESVQNKHAEEMKSGSSEAMEGMDHGGDERSVTVKPGETGEITTTFDEGGSLIVGCHEPGHFEGGMVGSLTVT